MAIYNVLINANLYIVKMLLGGLLYLSYFLKNNCIIQRGIIHLHKSNSHKHIDLPIL